MNRFFLSSRQRLCPDKAQQERWTADFKDVNEESNLSLYWERIGMHALLSFFPKFPLLVSEANMIKRRWSSLARHGMYAGAVQTRRVVPWLPMQVHHSL